MARGRNFYIKGASNDEGISEEARHLIANARHAENIEEWEVGPGIGAKKTFSQFRINPDDIDDDQEQDMVYFPHRGEEEWPKNYKPSPVLLVQRVKHLKGEPWWHKLTCERIGLGIYVPQSRRVALPNLSFYTAQLYSIKHLVKITPVEFPQGIPAEEDFDPRAVEITQDGTFLMHEKIRQRTQNLLEKEADRLKMQQDTFVREARSHWKFTWNSPLGNSNYHRNTKFDKPEKKDTIYDSSRAHKY